MMPSDEPSLHSSLAAVFSGSLVAGSGWRQQVSELQDRERRQGQRHRRQGGRRGSGRRSIRDASPGRWRRRLCRGNDPAKATDAGIAAVRRAACRASPRAIAKCSPHDRNAYGAPVCTTGLRAPAQVRRTKGRDGAGAAANENISHISINYEPDLAERMGDCSNPLYDTLADWEAQLKHGSSAFEEPCP